MPPLYGAIMNALSTFHRQQDQSGLDDFYATLAAPETGAMPRAVLSALSRTGSGQIIRSRDAQTWLTHEYGVNPGKDHNRQEVGAVFIDFDWLALQWRVIGGAA